MESAPELGSVATLQSAGEPTFQGGTERLVFAFVVISLSGLLTYAFLRASRVWNANAGFVADDILYARMCLPEGLGVWFGEHGFYRILKAVPFALMTRAVAASAIPYVPLGFAATAVAAVTFVGSCIKCGMQPLRAALLLAVLISSPFMLETVGFWMGSLNHALTLLLMAGHLWAVSKTAGTGFTYRMALIITSTIVVLGTYEIVLPFVFASGFVVARDVRERLLIIVAALIMVVFIAAVFAVNFVAGALYLLAAGAHTMRYLGLLFIFGAASAAWAERRIWTVMLGLVVVVHVSLLTGLAAPVRGAAWTRAAPAVAQPPDGESSFAKYVDSCRARS